MALTSKKYSAIHTKTGSDLTSMQDKFDNAKHLNVVDFEPEAAIIYQMQKMQDELDYLRTEISSNKDKTTFPGFGTSNSTALVGDTKLISIGANTTVSFGDMVVGARNSTITITAVYTNPSNGKVTTATHKLTLA
tara:strand:+ start:460 stop:864 length:405 start_codon:yes stop_codon:yes gene_type:complete